MIQVVLCAFHVSFAFYHLGGLFGYCSGKMVSDEVLLGGILVIVSKIFKNPSLSTP